MFVFLWSYELLFHTIHIALACGIFVSLYYLCFCIPSMIQQLYAICQNQIAYIYKPPCLFLCTTISSITFYFWKDSAIHIILKWRRATSHTRLRAHDHYTSSTLIGGKCGAGPSSFRTMLEGRMEYISECMMDVKSTWIPTWHRIDHVSWSRGLFQKPPLGGRFNIKPGDHCTPNAHSRSFILCYHAWGPQQLEIHRNSIWLRTQPHLTSHYTWGSVTTLHDFGSVLGWPLDTFFSGSHNFMVTALGSCVKWP